MRSLRTLVLTLLLAAAAHGQPYAPPSQNEAPGLYPVERSYSNSSQPAQQADYQATLPPPAADGEGLAISPPSERLARQLQKSPEQRTTRNGSVGVLASLAVVVGLFLLLAWVIKRGMPAAAAPLDASVVEVLGRAPLATRQQVHVIRFGNKLLLVSVTPGGAETLSEITDPLEVDRLSGICKQTGADSATGSFRQLLERYARGNDAEDRSAGGVSAPVGTRPLGRKEAGHAG